MTGPGVRGTWSAYGICSSCMRDIIFQDIKHTGDDLTWTIRSMTEAESSRVVRELRAGGIVEASRRRCESHPCHDSESGDCDSSQRITEMTLSDFRYGLRAA